MTTRPRSSKVELLVGLRANSDAKAFRAGHRHVVEAAAGVQCRGVGQTWSLQIPPGELPLLPYPILMRKAPCSQFSGCIARSCSSHRQWPERRTTARRPLPLR